MKKLLLTIICLSGIGLAHAQTVTAPSAPAPAVTPTAAPAAAQPNATQTLPHQALVTLIAGQIVSQMNNTANTLLQAVEGGIPAQQNGQPPIEAKDLQAALGPEYVAWLRSVAAGPGPTPKK